MKRSLVAFNIDWASCGHTNMPKLEGDDNLKKHMLKDDAFAKPFFITKSQLLNDGLAKKTEDRESTNMDMFPKGKTTDPETDTVLFLATGYI